MHKKNVKKIKRSKIQTIRYFTLSCVIGFFIFIPLSNKYANYKTAYNNGRLVTLADGPVNGAIYSALDKFYSLWEEPVDAATSNNGSLWAYTILGVPLSDPLGLMSELINSVKFPLTYLLGAVIPILLTLILGRFFCSWLCPMKVIYGITGRLKKIMDMLKIPLMTIKLPIETRIIMFWSGLVLSYFMGAWVWHFILPYISFTHEIFGIIIFGSFSVGIYFLIALVVLDIGLIQGEFCRSVCPTGWLLSKIGQASVLRLNVNKSNCPPKCQMCFNVCPYDLFPKEGLIHSCHLCFKCVDNCPIQHIELGLNPIYGPILSSLNPKPKQNIKNIAGEKS